MHLLRPVAKMGVTGEKMGLKSGILTILAHIWTFWPFLGFSDGPGGQLCLLLG